MSRRPAPVRVRRARAVREAALGYLLVLPALAVFGVFVFYPFVENFRLALYQTPPYPGLPSHFVGLHQVGQVLSSSGFLQSLASTLLFVVMVVPAGLLIGLVLAVAAHRRLRGMAAYRVIFSSTVVSSVAVSALVFGTLMDPVVGLLPWLGLNPSPPILQNTTWALPAIAVMTIWQFLGLSFIVMSAGLSAVPEEVLEAARVDGASERTVLWRVTVPLLSPTIFFGVVVATIYAFQTFGQVDILIGYSNAAFEHVNLLVYDILNTIEIAKTTGQAAVLSLVLFVLTLGVTLVQLRLIERRVHYGS
ncbi:MAG TPA: sugar ABC transporter permease [Acidimicrobiales bacterium]|nr:sugar ABC transporter permease [Acidimicrobiales bacterium]